MVDAASARHEVVCVNHCRILGSTFRPPNVLCLSRVRPFARGCATPRVALFEPRKRRAKRRPHVGSCGELARSLFFAQFLESLDVGQILRAAARLLVLQEMLSREHSYFLIAEMS